jgi:hypothetical protein
MATMIEAELPSTWRALSGADQNEGWRYIVIKKLGPCTLHAGRRFPGNEEALLVSFEGAKLPGPRQLPKARGFEVAHVALPTLSNETSTIGLIRESQGSLELFSMMAQDIVAVMERSASFTVQEMMQGFLRRVATWQEFMQRPGDQLLSSESELGLVGELLTLELLIEAGVQPLAAVEGWQGPEDGIHDFVLGSGAIEVKSSIATSGFPARIGSLDQLDDAIHKPLYLCGQRLTLDPDGATLPRHVARLRETLAESGALSRFEVRMLHAGFFDRHSDGYTRCFVTVDTKIFAVDAGFPRLTPARVGPEIRHAIYGIDLDLVAAPPVAISDVLNSFGIM